MKTYSMGVMFRSVTVFSILFSIVLSQEATSKQQPRSVTNRPQQKYKGKTEVLTGLDILLEKKYYFIQERSIALVTNQTGVDKVGTPNYQRFMEMEDVDLKVIFTPEKDLFDKVNNTENTALDPIMNNLPTVIDIFKYTTKPTPEMLAGITTIVYDIQDIGARSYTCISTLGLVMEAAGELNIPVLVLDRPNLIRGDMIEGPILNMEFRSFIGYYPLPIRYGGTVGTLANSIIANNWISHEPVLDVISMEGWNEKVWFDETNLVWVDPSPNIPDLETAIIYPGMCLLEATNISEGKGTEHPFKWIGAPWVDGWDLSQALNKFDLPGVNFLPRSFMPKKIPDIADRPKFEDQKCSGVEIWVTDRDSFKSVDTGVLTLFILYAMYPDKIELREKELNMYWGNNTLFKELIKGSTGPYFLKHYN